MIQARISKDGEWLVCGRVLPNGQTCGERLAHVEEEASGITAWLSAGFTLDPDGVTWRLGKHARKQWERDRARASQGDRAAAERLRRGESARPRRLPVKLHPLVTEQLTDPSRPVRLPLGRTPASTLLLARTPLQPCHHIICPVCGARNRLDDTLTMC